MSLMVGVSDVATGPGSASLTSALSEGGGLFNTSSAGRVASLAGFAPAVSAGGLPPAGGGDSVLPHPPSARMLQVVARSQVSVMCFSVKDRKPHSRGDVRDCRSTKCRYVGTRHDM